MFPVDTKIWAHRVPGHIPENTGEEEEDSEEEEFIETAEERLEAVLRALGSKWADAPLVDFAAVDFQQRGFPTVKLNPAPTNAYGRKPLPPSFRISNVCAPIVSKTLLGNGLLQTGGPDWTIQWSGPGIRDSGYQSLNEYQRVNHFPGSTELTRKDRLWSHFNDMKQAFGADSFDFVPDSFVIPDQVEQFLDCYEKTRWTWIVKPNASSQGKGIFLLRDLKDLPLDECSVVSRYVDNPLLIQGLKFDLRIYVLVTSYTPLRAYVYREGLTRFASSPYSMEPAHLNDAYRHLTNYSVNKTALNFVENQEEESDNYGHKWSLSALNRHLRCVGINVNLMWARINDLMVKTLLSVEPSIAAKTRAMTVHNNCFECYGFDVLVDDQLKPWLLEVNLSPSMKAESPLDWKVKSSLLADAFHLVGVHSPNREAAAASRLRTRVLQARQASINQAENQAPNFAARRHSTGSVNETRPPSCGRAETPASKTAPFGRRAVDLDRLNEDQLRMLAQSLQEVKRSRHRNFVRLYPTRTTSERYLPITDYKGARGEHTRAAESLRISQSAAARLLNSVMFGPPPIGLAVGERRLSRLRCPTRGGNDERDAQEQDLQSPKHQTMLSLDSGTTKASSEDYDRDSDTGSSDHDSKEELPTPADLSRRTPSPVDVGSGIASGVYGGENVWGGFPPPPLPRPSLLEGARAAARAVMQSVPAQPPPRPLPYLHHRSMSTPVLPKLFPESLSLQPLRSRQNSSQWGQAEPLSLAALHREVIPLHVSAPAAAGKPKRVQQPSILEALAANLNVDIEL